LTAVVSGLFSLTGQAVAAIRQSSCPASDFPAVLTGIDPDILVLPVAGTSGEGVKSSVPVAFAAISWFCVPPVRGSARVARAARCPCAVLLCSDASRKAILECGGLPPLCLRQEPQPTKTGRWDVRPVQSGGKPPHSKIAQRSS
jgi:hypothetical protein